MSDIVDRLRAASHYALMDAARALVLQAADEIERLRTTNLDAAPAARADSRPLGNTVASAVTGTGNQPAPPCVETDGFSPGSSGGKINRSAERESPRRECGESSLRDVPQHDNCRAAGGPEHHISDRSQPVKDDVSDRSKPISDDRLAALEQLSALDQELELKHGITGNPMIKAQVNNHPVSYAKNDENRVLYDTKSLRNGALSGCETVPDPDSRVWDTPCTPPPHATPPQGSVQEKGSFRHSQNAKEPVAWAVRYKHGDTGIVELLRTLDECRHRWANRTTDYWQYEPLYRRPQPTLTDEEREAVSDLCEFAEDFLGDDDPNIATLRGLLERLK